MKRYDLTDGELREDPAGDLVYYEDLSPTSTCSAVWVVVGATGEHSGYFDWNMAAFTDEKQAKSFKDACQREAEKANGKDCKPRNGFRHAYDTQFYCDYEATSPATWYSVDMVQVFDSFTPNKERTPTR